MYRLLRSLILTSLVLVASVAPALAQGGVSLVQLTSPFTTGSTSLVPIVAIIPISATGSSNAQTTLTIPAPAGALSNYVCSLAYELGNDNTGTAVTNVVSTSTNFNAFAVKISQINTASQDSGVLPLFNLPLGGGCVKSTIPGTATTFVSPSGVTHGQWTWYATYYQAP